MKRYMSVLVLVVSGMSLPATSLTNPVWPGFLTEVRPDSNYNYIIELYNNGAYHNLNGFLVQTTAGTAEVRPGIEVEMFEYKALLPGDFLSPVLLSPLGDHVQLYEGYGGLLGEVTYGDGDVDVEAPGPGQSVCGHFGHDDYGYLIVDFWYRDGSPTFGAENDTAGALGTIAGMVTDRSTGLRIDNALITCEESGFSTSTDSAGAYALRTYAIWSTLEVSAPLYDTYRTPTASLDVDLDATFSLDVELTPSSGIDSDDPKDVRRPRDTMLAQNFPNPFNPMTVIDYTVPGFEEGRMKVLLKIHDARGRLIKTLVDDYRTAGSFRVSWDGKSDAGTPAGSGIYFYTLKVGDLTSTRKMIVAR